MEVSERSRCARHGDPTASGRCATCDALAGRLIQCAGEGCSHEIFYVPARAFPELCGACREQLIESRPGHVVPAGGVLANGGPSGTTWEPPTVIVTGLLGGPLVGGLTRRAADYWTVYVDGVENSFDPRTPGCTVRYLSNGEEVQP